MGQTNRKQSKISEQQLRTQKLLWFRNAAMNLDDMIEEDFTLSERDIKVLKETRKIFRRKFEETKNE